MINKFELAETMHMIDSEHLDIRTITMGISLLDCADSDINKATQKIYDKICLRAEKLVSTGETIEKELDPRVVKAALGLKDCISKKTGNMHKFANLSDNETSLTLYSFQKQHNRKAHAVPPDLSHFDYPGFAGLFN